MRNNIITATVSDITGRITVAPAAYQWDYGIYLRVVGLDLPEVTEWHFSRGGEAMKVLGDSTGVMIPDEYLEVGGGLYAYLYMHTGLDDGETVYTFDIPVIQRPKPEDIEPTPEQQDIIEQAVAAINAALDELDDMASAEGVGEGKVLTAKTVEEGKVTEWEFTAGGGGGGTGDYSDLTNKPKINNVTLSGNKTAADLGLIQPSDITATKVGDTTTIYVHGVAIATVKDGTNGQDGEDGFSPSASVSKSGTVTTITVTDKNGTTTAQVNDGQDGQPGSPGQDGQPGTDGFSPSASVSKSGTVSTLTVTDKTGTTTVQINDGQDGQPGQDGEDGEDGHTPVKGTDYWTSADKEEIVQDVLDDISISTTPQWTDFPHRTNPAIDAHNSYSQDNAYELGTAATLRHNMMIEGSGSHMIATWTESTGSKDYADSSGQTSVYAQAYYDKWQTAKNSTNATIIESTVVDVFPQTSTVYDGSGNPVCTITAASDSTVRKVGNVYHFIGTVYGSDGSLHIVYRTATVDATPSITLGNDINVLMIDGSEWDMRTLREDYTQKTSQCNTKIIYRQNYYYMAVVQNGVGVAIMRSSDCVDWEFHAHVPDEKAHLEAGLCVLPWVSNNTCGAYVAVRHSYGDGYVTLHGYQDLTFQTKKATAYIPGATGRPMMLSDDNVKVAYLAYSVNGRHESVLVRLSSNGDGSTGYNIFTSSEDVMSNYPCVSYNSNFLWFGGTNGLGSNKKGVSACILWSEELTDYDGMGENLMAVAEHGAWTPAFTSADSGKFLTINSTGDIVATALSTWSGGSY